MSYLGENTGSDAFGLTPRNFDDEESLVVSYDLEQVVDRVRLVLTHRRLESEGTNFSVSGGWHIHLDILADLPGI